MDILPYISFYGSVHLRISFFCLLSILNFNSVCILLNNLQPTILSNLS